MATERFPGTEALASLVKHLRQPVVVTCNLEGMIVSEEGILESVSPVRVEVGTFHIPTLGFKSFVKKVTCLETGRVLYECVPPECYEPGNPAAVLAARRQLFGPNHATPFIPSSSE